MKRAHRQRVMCAAAIAVESMANTAAADPVVIKQMFNVVVGESPLEDQTLTSPSGADVRVRVTDGGKKIGGGARTTAVYHRMRGSLGIGAFGIRGARYEMEPRLVVSDMTASGFYVELAAGYEFRLGPLFPYTDLRAHFELTSISMILRNDVCGDRLQPLTPRTNLGLGPSVGVFIPVAGYFFADVSGQVGVVGERSFGALGGIGFWFPSE